MTSNADRRWAHVFSAAMVDRCGRVMDLGTDAALHLFISAFLEGDAKVIAATDDLIDVQGPGSRKSRLELWRLPKYRCDNSPTFTASVLEMNFRGATWPKGSTTCHLLEARILETAHPEYQRPPLASKGCEFMAMRQNQVYPELFKKAGFL